MILSDGILFSMIIILINNGHGPGFQGLLDGVTNNNIGIASISYNFKLMPVRGQSYNSIIYAAENGAAVINCSWNGAFSNAGREAVDYASGLGSIILLQHLMRIVQYQFILLHIQR